MNIKNIENLLNGTRKTRTRKTPGMHTLTVTTKWGQDLRFERSTFKEISSLADTWIECSGYKIVSPSGRDMIEHIVLESSKA